MNHVITPDHVVSNDILVSGLKHFPESRWRQAILHYLFGVWSNDRSVTNRPEIMFGNITLRFERELGGYVALRNPARKDNLAYLPQFPHTERLEIVSSEPTAIEVGLIRFVKDNQIRQLALWPVSMSPISTLYLWKKEKRGEYGCLGWQLPLRWSPEGPEWRENTDSLS